MAYVIRENFEKEWTQMKKSYYISLLILSTSCLSAKYVKNDFQNQTYVCDNDPMVGKTTITFMSDTFKYIERNGLFTGEGVWSLSSNGKQIILKGMTSEYDSKGQKLSFRKEIKFKLEIKNKNKLTDENQTFIKQ